MDNSPLLACDVTRTELPVLRARLTGALHRAGVADLPAGAFVHAVLEVAGNAVVHGGGSGRVVVRIEDDELRGEVTDAGPGPAAVALAAASNGSGASHGLAMAETLTDRMELHPGPEGKGTAVILAVYLDEPSS